MAGVDGGGARPVWHPRLGDGGSLSSNEAVRKAPAAEVTQRRPAGGPAVVLFVMAAATIISHTGAYGPLRLQIAMSPLILSCVALHRDTKFDVLEGCAGGANITAWAPEYGLTAIQPADLVYGWNLGTADGRRHWKLAVTEGKPLLTIFSAPCTLWCF